MQTGKAGKCGVGAETGKEREARMKEAERLAGYIMHKHYCEHDVEAVTALFSTEFSWLGAGEEEYVASRAIRRLGRTGERPDAAEIPIIALTANAFADDAYQARIAGMNEHVAKPLEINRLLEIMSRWVK